MKVVKDFTTRASRFKAGQDITAADLAGDLMSLEDRSAKGFVAHDGGVVAPPATPPLVGESGGEMAYPAARPRKGAVA